MSEQLKCPAWLDHAEVGCDKEWGHNGQHKHEGYDDMPLGGTVFWSEKVPARSEVAPNE